MASTDLFPAAASTGDVAALKKFRESSDFFCDRWKGDLPGSWEGVTIADSTVTVLKVVGTYSKRVPMPELPPEVGLLVGLRTLELCWMKRLSKLPPDLGKLVQLTSLNLSGCQQLYELPAEIERLTELSTVDLSQCRALEKLPTQIGALAKLQALKLADCYALTKVPAEVGQLVELKTLTLAGCEQLVFPPKELQAAPVDELVGFLAAHLIVQGEEVQYAAMYDIASNLPWASPAVSGLR